MRSSRDAGAIQERVIELISELVHAQGYDVEDVVVTSAGKHSAVRIMVDSDAGIELDAAAEISRLVSELFDTLEEIGETPYTLEVTSPGIDRPLTLDRHWRRARGRKARIDLAGETVVGRIGTMNRRFRGSCHRWPWRTDRARDCTRRRSKGCSSGGVLEAQ